MRWNNIGSWTASGLKKESVSVSSLKESSKVHIGGKRDKTSVWIQAPGCWSMEIHKF